MESIQQREKPHVTMSKDITPITMSAFRAQDPAQGSGGFLVEVVRHIDGLGLVDRKPELAAVEVFVLGEDGSERKLVLPYAPGSLRGVPVDFLANRLGCSPAQIEQV